MIGIIGILLFLLILILIGTFLVRIIPYILIGAVVYVIYKLLKKNNLFNNAFISLFNSICTDSTGENTAGKPSNASGKKQNHLQNGRIGADGEAHWIAERIYKSYKRGCKTADKEQHNKVSGKIQLYLQQLSA